MNRRTFLRLSGVAGAALAWPLPRVARAAVAPPGGWRTFEVRTEVEVLQPKGRTRVWVPLPLSAETAFQRPLGNVWDVPAGRAAVAEEPPYGVGMLVAEWAEGVKPLLSLQSRVALRDWHVDLSKEVGIEKLSAASRALWTAPTRLLPTDGLVRSTALEVTAKVKGGDVERARALYAWVCDNSFRDPKVRGCGLGDIRSMLASGSLGGKCADINALFVGLARAIGIPARDTYGVRVADSQRGYQVLGRTGDVTKAQHCRAEFFADGYGWIPADPGDVRKLILEEPPGNLSPQSPKVAEVRSYLFGNWEGNWMAYNNGHDVSLPGSSLQQPLPFLMYPQAETAEGMLDCLNPTAFRYGLTSREISTS